MGVVCYPATVSDERARRGCSHCYRSDLRGAPSEFHEQSDVCGSLSHASRGGRSYHVPPRRYSHRGSRQRPRQKCLSAEAHWRGSAPCRRTVFWNRYAFGIAVLQRDIRERSWLAVNVPLDLETIRSERYLVGILLRKCTAMTLSIEDAANSHSSFEHACSHSEVRRQQGVAAITQVFITMQTMGFGVAHIPLSATEAPPTFVKKLWRDLAEPAITVLQELRVPPYSFGSHFARRAAEVSDPVWTAPPKPHATHAHDQVPKRLSVGNRFHAVSGTADEQHQLVKHERAPPQISGSEPTAATGRKKRRISGYATDASEVHIKNYSATLICPLPHRSLLLCRRR